MAKIPEKEKRVHADPARTITPADESDPIFDTGFIIGGRRKGPTTDMATNDEASVSQPAKKQ